MVVSFKIIRVYGNGLFSQDEMNKKSDLEGLTVNLFVLNDKVNLLSFSIMFLNLFVSNHSKILYITTKSVHLVQALKFVKK